MSFLKSAFSALGDGLKPTCSTFASTPAIAHTSTTGAAPAKAWPPTVMNSSPMSFLSTTLGSLMRSRIVTVASAIRWYIIGPKAESAMTAAIITIAPLASTERAT